MATTSGAASTEHVTVVSCDETASAGARRLQTSYVVSVEYSVLFDSEADADAAVSAIESTPVGDLTTSLQEHVPPEFSVAVTTKSAPTRVQVTLTTTTTRDRELDDSSARTLVALGPVAVLSALAAYLLQ